MRVRQMYVDVGRSIHQILKRNLRLQLAVPCPSTARTLNRWTYINPVLLTDVEQSNTNMNFIFS